MPDSPDPRVLDLIEGGYPALAAASARAQGEWGQVYDEVARLTREQVALSEILVEKSDAFEMAQSAELDFLLAALRVGISTTQIRSLLGPDAAAILEQHFGA